MTDYINIDKTNVFDHAFLLAHVPKLVEWKKTLFNDGAKYANVA